MSNPSAIDPNPPPDPLIGTVISERYRVLRKLGEGGMGVVYEGEHVTIKRRVAIKTLHAHLARNGEVVARFHREALAATQIGNEHIVEALDMGRLPDGAAFLVLEFLEGREFAALIEKESPLPIGRVCRIAMEMCEALQAAHDKNIVHRDLKPANVMLVRRSGNSDFVKVLDFGISKFLDDSLSPGSMTKTGATIGTAYYMSPEQLQGDRGVDHRTDLWAIGVILFEALTQRYPFEADSLAMLSVQILTESAPDVRRYRLEVPGALAEVIARLLTRDKHQRPSSCNELRALLSPFTLLDSAPQSHPPVEQTWVARDSNAAPAPAPAPIPLVPKLPVTSFALTGPPADAQPAYVTGEKGPKGPSPTAMLLSGGPAVAPARPVGPIVAIAFGGLALLAAGTFGVSRLLGHSTDTHTPNNLVQPEPAADASMRLLTVTEVPDAGARSTSPQGGAAPHPIHVTIRTEPRGASLKIDGQPYPCPFDGELESNGRVRRLEFSLARYRTLVQEVVLEVPQNVVYTLERGTGVVVHRLDPTAPPAPPPPPTPVAPASPPPPPAPAAPPPAVAPPPTPPAPAPAAVPASTPPTPPPVVPRAPTVLPQLPPVQDPI